MLLKKHLLPNISIFVGGKGQNLTKSRKFRLNPEKIITPLDIELLKVEVFVLYLSRLYSAQVDAVAFLGFRQNYKLFYKKKYF